MSTLGQISIHTGNWAIRQAEKASALRADIRRFDPCIAHQAPIVQLEGHTATDCEMRVQVLLGVSRR